METDRTKDSIEQLEERNTVPNPITEDASLGEAGDALRPQGEAEAGIDKDDDAGPAPHITQMPR